LADEDLADDGSSGSNEAVANDNQPNGDFVSEVRPEVTRPAVPSIEVLESVTIAPENPIPEGASPVPSESRTETDRSTGLRQRMRRIFERRT
jgi:hypothetical protein